MDELIEGGSFYHTSFFQIFLQGQYNEDLSSLNTTNLGLFVHEYIHYIQNIATPWGIYSALHEYKRKEDNLNIKPTLFLDGKIAVNINFTSNVKELNDFLENIYFNF